MYRKYKKTIFLLMTAMLALGICGCDAPSIHSITRMRFDHFLDRCLKEYASSDIFSLHYKIEDPEAYGIEKSSLPSFPDLSEEGAEEKLKTARNLLTRLNSYRKDSLTEDQQLVYDLLKNDLEISIETEEKYPYYTSAFGSSAAICSLASSLAVYDFENQSDVEEYLTLLSDLPDYLSDLVDYEKQRQDDGIAPSAKEVKDTLDALDLFLDTAMSENILSTSFEERINGVSSLSKDDIAADISQNSSLLDETVLPAYRRIRERISSEFSSSDGPETICQYENGQDYYDFLLRYQVGTDFSGEECKEVLLSVYKECGDEIKSLLESDPDLSDDYATALPTQTDAQDILATLKKNCLIYFPAIDDISYDVKNSEDSIFSQNTLAYYITPPYGSSAPQTIYLNPLATDDTNLFTTLAHEGYPGHLYQINYFYENLYHPIQLYLTCDGYEEGWGTYAQLYSYECLDFTAMDESSQANVRTLMKDYSIESNCLCSLCDIYVNYEGKSKDEICSWLERNGASTNYAESLYNYVIANPTAYLSYSIGYYEIESLKDQATDCSLEQFHKNILSCGPCPFYILKDYMAK